MKTKSNKKNLKPNIKSGGVALNIGEDYFLMKGRKHKDGGIKLGSNKNGIEVEDGEIMKTGGNTIKVFSDSPMLNGVSPAKRILNGENPNAVFKAQEDYKDANGINDDGSKSTKKAYKVSKKFRGGGTTNKNGMYYDENGNIIKITENNTTLGDQTYGGFYDPQLPFDRVEPETESDYYPNALPEVRVQPETITYPLNFKRDKQLGFGSGNTFGLKTKPLNLQLPLNYSIDKNMGFGRKTFGVQDITPTKETNDTTNPLTFKRDDNFGFGRKTFDMNSIVGNDHSSTGAASKVNDVISKAATPNTSDTNPAKNNTASVASSPIQKVAVPNKINSLGLEVANVVTPQTLSNPSNNNTSNNNPSNNSNNNSVKTALYNNIPNIASLGINLIGAKGSYDTMNRMLDRTILPSEPVNLTPTKLKTKINIEPQLDRINRSLERYNAAVDNNSSNSKLALARKRGASLDAVNNANMLYGNKENQETQLINQDRLNTQSVQNQNANNYNSYLKDRVSILNQINTGKAQNIVSLLNNYNSAIQGTISNVQKELQFKNTLKVMKEAYPNASSKVLEEIIGQYAK